jgi:hypothetical protein
LLYIANLAIFAQEAAQAPWRSNIEAIKNICEIGGILVGGLWTYLNYFRGRIYKSRLEPTVTCRAEMGATCCCLVVFMQVKCAGSAQVFIDRHGTGLMLYGQLPRAGNVSEPKEVRWAQTFSAVNIFPNHVWVEAGEVISEQVMIELPNPPAHAYKVRVKLNSGEYSWTTITTANVDHDLTKESNNGNGQPVPNGPQ